MVGLFRISRLVKEYISPISVADRDCTQNRTPSNAGLIVKNFFADVAGTTFDPDSSEFALIAEIPLG